jgi:hypothetical protein
MNPQTAVSTNRPFSFTSNIIVGSSTSLDQNIPRPLLPPQAARCYHDVDADDDVDFDGVDVDGVDVDGVDVDNDADLDDDTLQWLRS